MLPYTVQMVTNGCRNLKSGAKLWVYSAEDIKDYPKEIIVNALGVTKTGRDIYYLSSISVKNPETNIIADVL